MRLHCRVYHSRSVHLVSGRHGWQRQAWVGAGGTGRSGGPAAKGLLGTRQPDILGDLIRGEAAAPTTIRRLVEVNAHLHHLRSFRSSSSRNRIGASAGTGGWRVAPVGAAAPPRRVCWVLGSQIFWATSFVARPPLPPPSAGSSRLMHICIIFALSGLHPRETGNEDGTPSLPSHIVIPAHHPGHSREGGNPSGLAAQTNLSA